jgi:hypothetical protein
VWAWATTMVFAATGHPPFGDDTVVAVINRVMHEPPNLRGLPPDLHRLIASCLVKEPERRPTAQQLMMTLIGAGPAAETRMDDPAQATTLLAEGSHRAAGPMPNVTMPAADRTRAMGPAGAPPLPPAYPPRRPPYPPGGGYRGGWEPERKSRWPMVAGVGAILALALVVGLIMASRNDGGGPSVDPTSTVSEEVSESPTEEETTEDEPTPDEPTEAPSRTPRTQDLPTSEPPIPDPPTTLPTTPTVPTAPETPPDDGGDGDGGNTGPGGGGGGNGGN